MTTSQETATGDSATDTRRAELASLRIHRVDEAAARGGGGLTWFSLFLWLLSVLGAGGAGWAAASRSPTAVQEIEIFRVRSAHAAPAGQLTATGYLQATRRTSVGFKTSGRMLERLVDEGDRVKAGQVLARLEAREQGAAVRRFEAALAASTAALAELEAGFRKEEVGKARWALDQAVASRVKAEQDLARARDLMARKAAFRSQLDEAEAAARGAKAAVETARQQLEMMNAGARPEQIDAARAQVKQSDALLELARTQASETELKAPFDGTILEKHAEVGTMLMFGGPPGGSANAAEIFTLADLSELEAEVDIAEASLAQVTEGQPAEVVADAIPDRRFAGIVTKVLPRANRQKAIVPVKVRITGPDARLRPDLSVKVSFLERKAEESKAPPAPKIPLAALQERGGAKVVFLVQEGELRLRVVEAGKADGGEVEIVKGLAPGDAVAARPAADWVEGRRVKEK